MFDFDADNWQALVNLEHGYTGMPVLQAWASETFILSVSLDFWY